jgi:hypothetical protein
MGVMKMKLEINKKVVATLLAGSMALSLSGCAKESNEYENPTDSITVEYADDYSTIKRWVIDRIEEQEDRKNKKSEIKEKKGYYRHYNQRSYPDDFWDSFYCN